MDDVVTQPYPGLRPFTKNEARIFFGRRRQCIQLLKNLETQYFIAVTGQSGCGKSSFVKAGVIPLLERGTMPRGGRQWFTVETNPGEDPFGNLAKALHKTFVTDHKIFELSPEAIQTTVETGPLGILALLEKQFCIRVKSTREQGSRKNLLLLIDQFEEIFTYCEKHGFDTADRFISLLLETAVQQKFAIYIILTMRSDFLGRCCFFEGLPEAVSRGQFLVPKLNQDDIRSAIVGPQRYFNFFIQSDLVTKLLNDYAVMEADFQRAQDQLPLMQHVLMRLYHFAEPDDKGRKELTVNLYLSKKIQGLSKALNLHADDVYDNLPTRDHKKTAQIIFRRLTQKTTENHYVRSRASISEIIRICFHSRSKVFCNRMDESQVAQMMGEVADAFRNTDNCFLYPFLEKVKILGAADDLNITHESLIRCWDKCRQWADMEAKEADLFREIQKRGKRSLQGEPYATGKALDRYEAWLNDPYHSIAWAQRYCETSETCGRQYDRAVNFIRESRTRKIHKRIDKYTLLVAILWIFFASMIPAGAYLISGKYRECGNAAFDEKKYEDALEKYEDALRWRNIYGEPDAKLEIIRSIGTVYSVEQEHRKAINHYQNEKTELNQKAEINELILEAYRKYTIKILDPENTNTVEKRNKIREIIQELKTFQSSYDTENFRASEKDARSTQGKACILFLLGLAHQGIDDRKNADRFYDKAQKQQAQTDSSIFLAQAHFNWGMLFIQANDHVAAADRFIIASSLRPDRDDYILAAAKSLYESRQLNEAIRYYDKIRDDENKLDKYNIYAGKCIGLALCFKSKGDLDKAQKYLEKFKIFAKQSGGEDINHRIQKKVDEFNAIQ